MLPLILLLVLAQAPDLETRIARIQPGISTLLDVQREFGEPRKPPAGYDGFEFRIGGGVVREIEIGTPEWRYRGGLHVGSPLAEVFAQLGQPEAVVKTGLPQFEPRSGVFYESVGDKPGLYLRRDLGLALLVREGRVNRIFLGARRSSRLSELPRAPMDLCAADLSNLDLRGRAADLLQASFSSRTVWPPRERMPEGFDPARILETGRNPGLGVRALHARGITGKGVGIAVVDNPTRLSHRDYAARLRLHEYIGVSEADDRHFHGSTVLSIAAGVAPEADLYYISAGRLTSRAKAFERILEINRTLPPERRIRVVSMSLGWSPGESGAAEMEAAACKAKEAGLLVVTSNIAQTHGFRFKGLGRPPLADPDDFESYGRAEWWPERIAGLLIPMDSRTGAGPGADDEYIFHRRGGWSWSIPYLAGMYALAAQLDPAITPNRFLSLAIKTARQHALGPMLDPAALVASVK